MPSKAADDAPRHPSPSPALPPPERSDEMLLARRVGSGSGGRVDVGGHCRRQGRRVQAQSGATLGQGCCRCCRRPGTRRRPTVLVLQLVGTQEISRFFAPAFWVEWPRATARSCW